MQSPEWKKKSELSGLTYKECSVRSWTSLYRLYATFPSTAWVFRGQNDSRFTFKTSLERRLDSVYGSLAEGCRVEEGLLRRFKRHAGHYLSKLPNDDNYPEWLAVMQHYGAPTRLLDWTHSYFVALFFSLYGASASGSTAIWCFDWETFEQHWSPSLGRIFEDDRNVEAVSSWKRLTRTQPGIAKLNAFKLNERLIAQQGTFMIPRRLTEPFDQNLESAKAAVEKRVKHSLLKKIVIPSSPELRKQIHLELYRMNISSATLFPGLAGFAESLGSMMYVDGLLWAPATK